MKFLTCWFLNDSRCDTGGLTLVKREKITPILARFNEAYRIRSVRCYILMKSLNCTKSDISLQICYHSGADFVLP